MEETITTRQRSSKQMESRFSMKRHSRKQIALMEERISSWNMNGSVPILTFAGITFLTPMAGHLPLPSPLNQNGPGSDLLQANMEEQFHGLIHTSSNKDLVARLTEVLKAQPMENLPVSKSIYPAGATCSPLAREITLLCPEAFAPGSVLPPSLEQHQKQTDDNAASVNITKLEEHDYDQTIRQAATSKAKENHVDPLRTIHQGSVTKVMMARKNMEDKKPQESMVSVKSGNDKRLCLCGQVDSGKMVHCENPTCAYGWCHYSCVQVQRKPRKNPWFCPKCRRGNFEVEQGTASEELETELKQRKRSKILKRGFLGSLRENVERKSVERSVAAKKEEMVRLTEKEKWEATKAEWLKIAKEAKKDEGSGLTQRKPTILNSLVPEDKFFERIENRPRIENAPTNIGESSFVKLKDWDKVKEEMDKLAKLKRKEGELKNKMLKSFYTELELKDELVSVREEMISIMNQIWKG